jgi:hypothetical protein
MLQKASETLKGLRRFGAMVKTKVTLSPLFSQRSCD